MSPSYTVHVCGDEQFVRAFMGYVYTELKTRMKFVVGTNVSDECYVTIKLELT